MPNLIVAAGLALVTALGDGRGDDRDAPDASGSSASSAVH